MLNTVIIVGLAVAFVAYSKWPKAEEHFWFVSYEWVKSKERGAGRTCVVLKENDFDVALTENAIKTKNRFESIIINNFIQISKKTYELCIQQP